MKTEIAPFVMMKIEMVNDLAVRRACRALGGYIGDMQRNNAYATFTLVKRYACKVIRTGEGMMANIGKYARQKAMGVPSPSGFTAYFSHDSDFLYGRGPSVTSIEKTIGMPYKQSWKAHYTQFVDESSRFHALGILSGELFNGVLGTTAGVATHTEKYSYYGPRGGIHKAIDQTNTRIVTIFQKPEYIGYVHNGKPGVMPRPFFRIASKRVESDVAEHIRKNVRAFKITQLYPQYTYENDIKNRHPHADLRFDPLAVYPYFTIDLTDKTLSDEEVERTMAPGTKTKRSSKGRRGRVKKKKVEPAWKSTYREALASAQDAAWRKKKWA